MIVSISCDSLHGATDESASKVALIARTDETGAVKLKISSRTWDSDRIGYSIKRRIQKADGEWTAWEHVGGPLLQPNLEKEALKKNGLSSVLKDLDKKWLQYHRKQTTEELLDGFSDDQKMYNRAYFMSIPVENYEWAVAFGFAAVDANVPRGRTCEYVLYEMVSEDKDIRLGEVLDSLIVRSSKAAVDLPELFVLNATRTDEKWTRIRFRLRKKDLDRLDGLADRFAVLRSEIEQPIRDVVGHVSVNAGRPVKEDETLVEFEVIDKDTPEGQVKYGVAPYQLSKSLGGIGVKRAIVGRWLRPLNAIEQFVAENGEDGTIHLSWKHKQTAVKVSGYKLYRTIEKRGKKDQQKPDGTEDDSVLIATSIAPLAEKWIDKDLGNAKPGDLVQYRLVAVSGDSRENVESIVEVSVPYPRPAAPEKLSAKVLEESGKVYVLLTWMPVKTEHVHGYMVQQLEPQTGKWFEIASTGKDKTEVKLDMGNGHVQRTFRVKSLATGRGGMSKPSMPIIVDVPRVGGVPTQEVRFSKTIGEDGSATLVWTQVISDDVAGFRIHLGDKLVADEKVLSTWVRQYQIWDVDISKRKDFTLSIVDKHGNVSQAVQLQGVKRDKTDIGS